MREDAYGIFWQEPERVRTSKDTGPRQLPPTPETDWTLPEGVDAYPDLSEHGALSVDVEAWDPNLKPQGPGYIRGDAYVCGVAVGSEAGYRQYYPVAHEIGPNLPKRHVFDWLRRELSRPKQVKIGAKLLYDMEALHSEGVKIEGPVYDIQIAEALLDETRLQYSLESIAQTRLREGKQQSEMLAWLKKAFGDTTNIKKNIRRAPSAVVGPYAESDIDLPLRLFKIQRELLLEQGLWNLFVDIESALLPMLLAMRLRGVPVDLKHAESLLASLNTKYQRHIDAIKEQTGITPDIWAAESLAKLFDKMGVAYPRTPIRANGKGGAPSFRKEWLSQNTNPFAKKIQEARHIDKFRGTFVQGYIIDGHVKGKIHGQFHSMRSDDGGTVSGRFSSSSPNLQNIPVRTAEGKLIRQAFVAEEGKLWWKFDWSQIEYRLIAHYAVLTKQPGAAEVARRYVEDPTVDYHQMVADMTGLPRQDAKNLNFGLAYGQGIPLLCANLGVELHEGMRIMELYHTKAPFIKPLAKLAGSQANANARITTLLGRRRRFNVWEKGNSKHGRMEQAADRNEYVSENNLGHFRHTLTDEQLKRSGWTDAEILDHSRRGPDDAKYLRALRNNGWRRAFLHKALNALIQGSAADVMKKAMVQCWNDGVFADSVLGAPHLTVHDELDGSFDPSNRQQVEALLHVKQVMENCVKLTVPMIADYKQGINWGALEEID